MMTGVFRFKETTVPKKINVEQLFNVEGYTYLGTERLGKTIKYKYRCDKGHESSMKICHWSAGHRCPECAGNKRLDIEYIRKAFIEEGYTLLTDEYTNSNQKLEYKCNNGHYGSISWNNWSTGYRCMECSGKSKKTLDELTNYFTIHDYRLHPENTYINNKHKLHLICPNEHDYYVSWDNWYTKNSRCPKCSLVGKSLAEVELFDFVKKICPDAISNDRAILKPLELDIVIPSKKIAIEYCGLYWHSILAGKERNYHLNKLSSCNIEGYRLITVFEDELITNKNIVFSRLLNILGGEFEKRIYARKCDIHEISSSEARNFCISNHLQGYYGALIRLGAFYNDELVTVMTFSRPSLAKGFKTTDRIIELSRFCSKVNYKVIGIASKLFSYFVNNFSGSYDTVISYADRRWSDGSLYNILGFEFASYTQPNYWYFKSNTKRLHRFYLRKPYGLDKGITEWDLRKIEGWNKIFDCGNLKFVKKLSQDKACHIRPPQFDKTIGFSKST